MSDARIQHVDDRVLVIANDGSPTWSGACRLKRSSTSDVLCEVVSVRIGICGPQGAGKTTLAKALAERLGLPPIEEQARIVAERFKIRSEDELREQPAWVQRHFQWECLRTQIDAEQALSSFVSDRTTIDNAAYWLAWCHATTDPSERLEYLHRAREWSRNYDLIIYCPPIGPFVKDDGFRVTDPDYQSEIDVLVRTLLHGWEISNWITVDGGPEERLRQALEAVDEMRSERKWEVASC